jgi:hypothetical protein
LTRKSVFNRSQSCDLVNYVIYDEATEGEYLLPQVTAVRFEDRSPFGLVYLVREPRRSTAPTSRLIPNENVLSRKGTLRL